MNVFTRFFLDPLAPDAHLAGPEIRHEPAKWHRYAMMAGGVFLVLAFVVGALTSGSGTYGAEGGHSAVYPDVLGNEYNAAPASTVYPAENAVAAPVAAAADGESGLFSKRFWFAYLVAYLFILTISLGALFFTMVNHITKATWSVVVRRVSETLAMNIPLLALFAIPILAFGMHDLYHWTHAELYEVGGPDYDKLVAGKRGYLNTPFFIGRIVLYLVAWSLISRKLYTLSVRQDQEGGLRDKMRFTSGWGLPVFAVTTAFAGFDFIMTLDPHWFSTMFGVYFFAGAFFIALGSVAFCTLFFMQTGKLKGVVTIEHQHDLAKFMFAFSVFWTYISFSQYVLYWYGNLPEETLWFRYRIEEWTGTTQALVAMHFFIPFFGMMPRFVKRTTRLVFAFTILFFAAHYTDLYWQVMPVYSSYGYHGDIVDVLAFLGFVGLFAGLTFWRFSRHALVPYGDPFYATSKHFHNI